MLCLQGPVGCNECVYCGVAIAESAVCSGGSNRATPVRLSLIICVPRANLILSGVVFEELTTAWGSIQDCRPVDESLNYQSEQQK